MNRRPPADLLHLDIEIERTLHNLRRITSAESGYMQTKEKDCRLFKKKKKKWRDLEGLTLWRKFGGLLYKRSTQL